ncbi:hypothetical protein RDABS01_037040 [Bienertia sinuspersici]
MVYGFSSKIHSLSPLAAEIQALRNGLLLAKQFQLSNVEVEIDAKTILPLLEDVQNNAKHDLIALILDVANLLKLEWQVTISHVNREANQVAHCLAQYAHLMEAHKVNHHAIPDCARKAYNFDLRNVTEGSSSAFVP